MRIFIYCTECGCNNGTLWICIGKCKLSHIYVPDKESIILSVIVFLVFLKGGIQEIERDEVLKKFIFGESDKQNITIL